MIRTMFAPATAIALGAMFLSTAFAQTPPGGTGTAPPPAATPPTLPPAGNKPVAMTAAMEKARELFVKQDFEGAYTALAEGAKSDPLAPHPRVQLAELYFEARSGKDARAQLERAAAEDNRHPNLYIVNASFAFGEGRVTDAILNLQTAVTLAGGPRWNSTQRSRFLKDAQTGLAACYETRGDWEAAKLQIQALLEADPKNSILRQRIAVCYFMLNIPEKALTEFVSTFKDDNTVDPPELRMGQLWNQKGDSAMTEEWLKKALAAHPKDAKVQRAYAEYLMNEGKATDAKTYLDEAEKLKPEERDTKFLRGLYYRYTKNHTEAEKIFEGLFIANPSDIPSTVNLALSLAESTDPRKKTRGINIAESVVRQSSQSADFYAVLGWCQFKDGKIDDAQRNLATAASGGRLPLDSAYYLSRILIEKNKLDDAYKILKEAVAAKGAFVNRPEAKALFEDLDKKLPKKPDDKKPEVKKPE